MPELNTTSALATNDLYMRHRADIDAIVARYPIRQSALMPILWLIQEEDGWISDEMMKQAAEICECTPAEVLESVSFYQMYHREPVGKYVLGICATLPCALKAADGLYAYLSEKLGITWAETTQDGLFTIQRRECLGACSEAPVMLVNQELETKLTREKIDRILEECRQGKRKPYFTGRNGYRA
ncbi:NAD(P)H-dependent oxidoreductase subunit E [bacterium]|nr:NAD(P)H-dependent oxidoreductase subunit E [bacterium]